MGAVSQTALYRTLGGVGRPAHWQCGVHDFHESLAIAIERFWAAGKTRWTWACSPRRRRHSCAGFSSSRMACPATTPSRLFRTLDPEQFRAAFLRFMADFSEPCRGAAAIDGKVLPPAASRRSTWCPPGAASNALCWRRPPPNFHDDVVLYLDDPASKTIAAKPVVDADHGRIETRTTTVSTDIAWLNKDHRWSGLAAVGKVERLRETAGKTTSETAYYLLSAHPNGSTTSSAPIGAWKIASRGGSTWS